MKRIRLIRLKALMVKESKQIVRDPSSILIAFVLPVILLFLFGYGVSLDSSHLKIGLACESNGAQAESLAQAFLKSSLFDVDLRRNGRAFPDMLTSGDLKGVITLSADFDRRLRQGNASIQILSDGSEPNTAGFVQNYAIGVIQTWAHQQTLESGYSAPPTIQIQPRTWYNPEQKSPLFLIPGSLSTIMAIIGTLLTSLVVAREWERGTMEALMSTPISMTEILLGKLVPYFVLGMGSMLLCTIIAITLFGLPFRGSILMLGLVSGVFLLAALGQGLLISTASKNQFVASQAALITAFLPAFILSGFVYEIPSMPRIIQTVSYILPARYLVSSLKTLFLVGDVPSTLTRDILSMGAIALILFLITLRKTKKTLD